MGAARALLADDMVFVGLFETYPNADAYIATFTQLMQIVTRLDVKTIIGEGDHLGRRVAHGARRTDRPRAVRLRRPSVRCVIRRPAGATQWLT